MSICQTLLKLILVLPATSSSQQKTVVIMTVKLKYSRVFLAQNFSSGKHFGKPINVRSNLNYFTVKLS